jgi:hypothetical protein
MTAIGALLILAAMVAVAMLAPLFGVDSRPSADEPAELWFGHRS